VEEGNTAEKLAMLFLTYTQGNYVCTRN